LGHPVYQLIYNKQHDACMHLYLCITLDFALSGTLNPSSSSSSSRVFI